LLPALWKSPRQAAPNFDLVILAGDALDVGSYVDAQIVVVKKYLSLLAGVTKVILCFGNQDLDERSPEGEKISRWIGDVRELGVACDGDSLTIGERCSPSARGGMDRGSSSGSRTSSARPRSDG
jgi:predicted MPP superfamily phosphohydrolase